MQYPKFSILSSVYIGESYTNFVSYVKSLENSRIIPNEIVLVYDGPVKESIRDFVSSYSGLLNFRTIDLGVNKGLGLALSEGLKYCSNDLVARLDTDDMCLPDRFENQLRKFKGTKSISALGGGVLEFSDDGKVNRQRIPPTGEAEIRRAIRFKNPLNHTTVMFRKQDVLSVGGYRDVRFYEDYDLWLRMNNAGLILENDEVIYSKFRVDGMLSRRFGYDMFHHEMNFLRGCLRGNLITKGHFLLLFFVRALPRLLPVFLITFLYKHLR